MCGLSTTMSWLIGWRAVQGFAAGCLMVTATAVIADIIPLRERGKYQGALGAVFGVTTVLGPLLGGLLTDHLSWQWIFYINLPIGIAVIVLAAFTMPSTRLRGRPSIDYLGIVFVSLGAAGLTLALSWGGTQHPWTSPTIVWMIIGSLVSLVIFALVERRATDPIMPLRLFTSSVFNVCVVLAFIVGFAMLGAMTFLPTYLQYVHGSSATESGLQTLPMVLGLLTMSLVSGTVVGRTGRYKIFPVVGGAVMAVGLYLLSRLGVDTPYWQMAVAMLVLGLGIGSSMQVLTIVVQSTSAYEDLGVATSGVTFFRTLGSSFGAAVFGTVYANVLSDTLPAAVAASPGVDPAAVTTPVALHAYPADQIAPIVEAYAHAMHVVFLLAVPVPLVAFVLAFFLKEVPLRGTARSTAGDVGDGFGMPEGADAKQQLQIAVARLLQRKGRTDLPLVRERSGCDVGTGGWLGRGAGLPARPPRPARHHRRDQPALPAAAGRPRARLRRRHQPRIPQRDRRRAPAHRARPGRDRQGHHRDARLARRGAQRLGRRRRPARRGPRRPGDQVRRGVPRADHRTHQRDPWRPSLLMRPAGCQHPIAISLLTRSCPDGAARGVGKQRPCNPVPNTPLTLSDFEVYWTT